MPLVTVTFVDSRNRRTRKTYEIESQADLATYGTTVQQLIDDLELVSDLGVERVDLIIPAIGTGHAAVDPSNVDVGATFSGYLSSGNGKKGSHKLPGVKDTFVQSDGSINLAGVGMGAYLSHFLTAGDFMISDGETVESWINGTLDK